MGNRNRGLYDKFQVRRTDGSSEPGGKRHGSEYFVLDLTRDKFATSALLAYASACEAEYPLLAADLRAGIAARDTASRSAAAAPWLV
jgi:hypothetical protein